MIHLWYNTGDITYTTTKTKVQLEVKSGFELTNNSSYLTLSDPTENMT